MSYLDSYKRLEKLCSEIMNNTKGVTSYIEEMQQNPFGAQYVRGWNEDLKKLKHYRWIRNNIVHEPGCTEEDMCSFNDELWLNNFHDRIMNQTDPLALLSKDSKNITVNNHVNTKPNPTFINKPSIKPNSRKRKIIAFILAVILLILAIWLSIYFYKLHMFSYA